MPGANISSVSAPGNSGMSGLLGDWLHRSLCEESSRNLRENSTELKWRTLYSSIHEQLKMRTTVHGGSCWNLVWMCLERTLPPKQCWVSMEYYTIGGPASSPPWTEQKGLKLLRGQGNSLRSPQGSGPLVHVLRILVGLLVSLGLKITTSKNYSSSPRELVELMVRVSKS